ncbi:MAG TPA: MOSC N-terminal beta barrel domain-containing protein, partial [Nitrososphaeraceae archaeon]
MTQQQIPTTTTATGTVVSLWRYPVKSMMGEELNSSHVTERGLVGDRTYAVVDKQTGKVASAKNPRKWGKLFDFRS